MEYMKKLLLILSSSLILTSCALWPSWFDSNEHRAMTDIVVLTADPSICARDDMIIHAKTIDLQSRWLQTYSKTLPDNEKIQNMNTSLVEMTEDLVKRYEDNKIPSRVFCESRVKNINKAANTMLEVSGRRPRP